MIKTELRKHQLEALDKAEGFDHFAILGEQRTGKTLIALAMADRWDISLTIIFCPKRTVKFKVWEQEMEKSLDNPRMKYLVLNFEQAIPQKKTLIRMIKKWVGKVLVIVDESHRIKTRGAKVTRAVKSIGRLADHRLMLGGTSVAEGLEDAWSQFDFLDKHIFGTYDQFKHKFIRTVEMKRPGAIRTFEKIVGYKNEEAFSRILEKYSHRVLLREIQETPYRVRRKKIYVDLKESLRNYQEMESKLVTTVSSGQKIQAHLVITQVMRLQQITGGFISEGEKVWSVGREKVDAMMPLIDELKEGFIVVVRYLDEMRRISRILDKRGIPHGCISGKSKPPETGCKTFILQIQSGLSIDLSTASAFIFYSWDYSMVNFEQVRFRALTYHSKKIIYYFLIGRNTIDEVILESVDKKVDLASLVCDRYRHSLQSVTK